jgi:glyoxylase-like metal-dependent hydrolase (beta-lactamase superfamily II)
VPGIRFVKCPGQTPGRTALHLSSGNAQLLLSDDAAYVPALSMGHCQRHGAFDQDGAAAAVSRRRLLDRVAADVMLICGAHLPWPGLNRIASDGTGYVLTARSA